MKDFIATGVLDQEILAQLREWVAKNKPPREAAKRRKIELLPTQLIGLDRQDKTK